MNIKISELYTKCEDMAKALGLSVNDRFVFDLQDDTSLESIKNTFKGIDKILLPGYGRYMVLMVSNEKPNVLMAVFPETEEFDLKLVLFNVKNQESLIVTDEVKLEGDEKVTLDNFEDALKSDEVEGKVNDFLFADEDEEEEDDKADDEKDDEEADKDDDKDDDKEDEVVEPGKDEEKEEKDEEKGDEEKDDEDKNPADLGDGEPADVEAGDEPETKDEEPSDAEKADDEEGDEAEDDDDVIEVVDDEEVDESEENHVTVQVSVPDGEAVDPEKDEAEFEKLVLKALSEKLGKEVTDCEWEVTGDDNNFTFTVDCWGFGADEDIDPADVGDNADKEIVVSEGDAGVADQGDGAPADVGTGADEDKAAKAEGVTGEGDGTPADVGTGADADKPAKEEGVTGEGDGKPAEVGDNADKDVVKEGTAPVDPAPAPATAPADTTPPVDAAAPVADTVTDPEKDIRALIKFYTDELARKTADETVSTEVVSGIQAIIAGLVKNLEAMTDLQDTETEEAKAAAKAAKDEKKPEGAEEVSEDGVPPSIEANPTAVADDGSPAAKVGGDAGVPVDQNVTLSTANMTPDLKTLQPADVDVALPPPDLVAVPGDPMNDLADVELTDAPAEEPTFDTTVDVPDVVGAGAIITDAPIDPQTGLPMPSPASDDAAVKEPEAPVDEPAADEPAIGDDGLPADHLDQPSDKFIDDQIASLGDTPDTAADPDAVSFVPGNNTINWSDNLYDTGAANAKDNADTVPAALKELKEYASRVAECVSECSGVNEVTIGRINKFCNLCATAYDTWHKIQDAMNASNPLREAMECNLNKTEMEKMGEETQDMAASAAEFDALEEASILNESADDFARVQDYIKSIKHLL